MKKIILLNFAAIFVCFIAGIICTLGYIYSPWWLLLYIFPILLGWIPFADLYEKIDENLEGVSTVVMIDFLLSVITLMIGPLILNEETFIGITTISTLFFVTITSMVLLYKLRREWIIRANDE